MMRTESASSPRVFKKTRPEEFDLVILGGGTGSTVAAWTFAGEGKQVAVVDCGVAEITKRNGSSARSARPRELLTLLVGL
jgi:hypothetical protein